MTNYDAAEVVKSVSALEAGRALGLEINHSGRCKCPIHGGRDYNMKLFNDRKGYYCFVCHARGDVIGLVEAALSVSFSDAIKWLSDAFHLGVDIYKPVDSKTLQRAKKRARMRRELEERTRQTDRRTFDGYLDAADFVREIERIIDERAPKPEDPDWDPLWCNALEVRPEAKELLEEAEQIMMGNR